MASLCRKPLVPLCKCIAGRRSFSVFAFQTGGIANKKSSGRCQRVASKTLHLNAIRYDSDKPTTAEDGENGVQITTKVKVGKNHPVPEEQKSDMEVLAEMVSEELHPSESQTVKRTEVKSKLLSRVMQMSKKTSDPTKSSVTSLFTKVEPEKPEQIESEPPSEHRTKVSLQDRNDQDLVGKDKQKIPPEETTMEIFKKAKRLGIFPIPKTPLKPRIFDIPTKDRSEWTCMDWLHKHQSDFAKKHFDHNKILDSFGEQIKLTEEGKMWSFPIDNEQGMEAEKDVPFHEHIFLDHKLEGWCPKSGPIRLFMTSIVISLSHSAHFTVQEKHDHIDWFRDYFVEKLNLLKRLGTVEQQEFLGTQQSLK